MNLRKFGAVTLIVGAIVTIATGAATQTEQPSFGVEAQILSANPAGANRGPYIKGMLDRVRANWNMLIPEAARRGQKGRVDILFSIARDGSVADLQTVAGSGAESLDQAARGAITSSNPFSKLPAEYSGELRIRLAFLYNLSSPSRGKD